MDSNHLRAVILKIEDRLSDNDRRRLHFFLGNDVRRRFRDDPSLSGTLSLMESLFDQDKINEQDFTFLINTFNAIKCFDAVRILKEHMRRMEINKQNQSLHGLTSILLQDQENVDKYTTNIPYSALINEQNTSETNNTMINIDNTNINPVAVILDEKSSKSKQRSILKLSWKAMMFILFFILLSLIGLAVSATIIQYKKISITKSLTIYDEQIANNTLTETIEQLTDQLNDCKKNQEQVTIQYGSRYGGLGGGQFNDAKDLQLSPMSTCTGVEVFWKSQLVAIRFLYGNYNSSIPRVYRGYSDSNDSSLLNDTFLLSDDEQINKVILYTGIGTGKNIYKVINTPIRHVLGIQFYTTIGRFSPLYGAKDGEEFNESYKGFILAYATGRSGTIIDMLQFVWYKQVTTRVGSRYGGSGGGPFDDGKDLQLLSTSACTGVEVFWCSKPPPYRSWNENHFSLVSIRFLYRNYNSDVGNIYHGYYGYPKDAIPSLSNDTFLLSNDEQINKVTLYVGSVNGQLIGLGKDTQYLCVVGIQFYTTIGRMSLLYGMKDEEKFDESYEGFVFGYATGRSGGFIDMLQFIWYKYESSSKIHDGVWVEAKDGKVPANAFVGCYEGNRSVYVVRVDFGECCVIPGKLVEMSEKAEVPYHDVLKSSDYQVLTNSDSKKNFKWVIKNSSELPPSAFPAGHERNNTVYVGRFVHSSGSVFLGKYDTVNRKFYYSYKGSIQEMDTGFEMLCTS